MLEDGRGSVLVGDVLRSYSRYVGGLDDLCQRLREKYWQAMQCRPGCVDCCSDELGVFPVEAAWILRYFDSLSSPRRRRTLDHLASYKADGKTQPCPFLSKGRCLLYAARPLLCRTEGFLLAHRSADGEWQVSACPHNFSEMDLRSEIPESDLVNLESLNQSLAVLNHAYVRAADWEGPERVRLSEILSLPPG